MRSLGSAHTRVLCGSAAFAAAVAGFGGVCAAQSQGDRLTQPAAYSGPFLTWAGKAGGPAATPTPQPQAQPSPAAEFASWPAPARQAPRVGPAPPRPYAAATPSRAPAYYAPAPRPRPPVAYVAPAAPQPSAAAPAADVAPPARPIRQHLPAQLAVSTPPAATAQAQPQAQPPAQRLAQNDTTAAAAASPAVLQPTGVHFYSLHREYGLTPDAVVTPKDRPMVLIGPPDDPPTQKQDNADGNGGTDKHGDAEGADD
jgi:hypothetical protein